MSELALATPVGCPEPASVLEIEQRLDAAETAVGALEADALGIEVEGARALFLCIDSELAPPQIARLYRLSGISRYVQGERARALADFQRARAIEPDAILDPKIGSPLQITYDAAEPTLGPTRELPLPIEGWTSIEGTRTRTAALDRESFLQWVGTDGEVRGNWFLAEQQPVPYPVRPAVVARQGRAGRNLLVTGIAGSLLGAGAMTGAAALEARVKRSDQLSSAQVDLVVANRALGYGGIGLAVVGVVVAGSSLVVGP